jgi:hypothetical protein
MAADGLVKTFDPARFDLVFGGVIITEYADGTFYAFSQDDNFVDVRGADGSINRINMNVNDATVEVTVSQTSRTNDALSALHLLDKNTNDGKLPFTAKDNNGVTAVFSPQAYIMKYADHDNGNALATRTWTFRLPYAQVIVGGNF